MFIKGTAIKSTRDFLLSKFPRKFNDWLFSLPPKSRKYYSDVIIASKWFPIMESTIIPLQKAAEFFYNGNMKKAFYEIGNQSANIGFSGIYKGFVQDSGIKNIIDYSTLIFETYYSGGSMSMKNDKSFIKYSFFGFNKNEELIAYRLAGSIQNLYSFVLENIGQVECDIFEFEEDKIRIDVFVKLPVNKPIELNFQQ